MLNSIRCCISCKRTDEKEGFIRITRLKHGIVIIKKTIKYLSGRSAYLCRNKECFSNAKKYHRLEKALKISVPSILWQQLENLV